MGSFEEFDQRRSDTQEQVVCDECGAMSFLGFHYRNAFDPTRLCAKCAQDYDESQEVCDEIDFLEAMAGEDDF